MAVLRFCRKSKYSAPRLMNIVAIYQCGAMVYWCIRLLQGMSLYLTMQYFSKRRHEGGSCLESLESYR